MTDRHHHHHHHHYYDKSGKNGKGQRSPNPHRFRRSRVHRVFLGVCGGIADYFGWKPNHVRLAFVVAVFVPGFAPAVFLAYFATALFARSQGAPIAPRYDSAEDERFWRNVSTMPSRSFSEIRHRYRRLEGRIADIERTVTAEEFRLNRAFKDIE